jgi:hypothetical protein
MESIGRTEVALSDGSLLLALFGSVTIPRGNLLFKFRRLFN